MKKIEWVLIVCGCWIAVEGFYWSIFGRPVDWSELPTILAVCAIAFFTFPTKKG